MTVTHLPPAGGYPLCKTMAAGINCTNTVVRSDIHDQTYCFVFSAAAVAAYGCLKALNTLLDGVAEMKHLLPVLEEIIYPIMAKCISSDGQDVLEDVLELLAYFTYFGGKEGGY